MRELWVRLLGADRLAGGDVERWTVHWTRLQTHFQVFLFLLAFAAAVYGIWWFYRREPAYCARRRKVFLACKTTERTKAGASKDLVRSLGRLQTDHFDLYQLHGVVSMEEVKSILAPGGALEELVEARGKGLVRFLGFSAHSEAAACALLDAFPFDAVMFPVNYVTWLKGKTGPRLMDVARRQRTGVIALKSLAQRKWHQGETRQWPKCWYKPVDTPEEASLALRFTLSQPVTAALSPSHVELLRWQMDAAENLSPLSAAETKLLEERAAGFRPVFSNVPG